MRFDILDSALDIDRHYILEASAGTGKTFSIEHLVIRLMTEGLLAKENLKLPLQLKEILVVTFTKAATRELKGRIRQTLAQTAQSLLYSLKNDSSKLPPYLKALVDQIDGGVEMMLRRVEGALFSFETHQIATIHSFAARILKELSFLSGVSLDAHLNDSWPDSQVLLEITHDFFRSHLSPDLIAVSELQLLLKKFHSPHQLALSLTKTATQAEPLFKMPSRKELQIQLQSLLFPLKQKIAPVNLAELLTIGEQVLKEGVKGTRFKVHKELASLSNFLHLLSPNAAPSLSQALDTLAIEKEGLKSMLHKSHQVLDHPLKPLFNALEQQILPFIDTYLSTEGIFFRLASKLQDTLKQALDIKEMLLPDALLQKLALAIEQPKARTYIRQRYRALIIDEFQDTDPLQWSIFKKVFLSPKWHGRAYLVGDPKQSIYRFRGADIYTYLSAIEHLGKEAMATLEVNYRADPSMIAALNALFSQEHSAEFFFLPKEQRSLQIRAVHSGGHVSPHPFADAKGSIHFIAPTPPKSAQYGLIKPLEESHFFPYIASEIKQLAHQGIPLAKIAILIKDRYQANRLITYLKSCSIAAESCRGTSIAQSQAKDSLIEVLEAILFPKNIPLIRRALGSQLFGWSGEMIAAFNENLAAGKFQAAAVLNHFLSFKKTFKDKGFACLFESLLYGPSPNSENSLFLHLAEQPEGIPFVDELEHLAHILIDYEKSADASLENLLTFLKELDTLDPDDPRLKCPRDPEALAVQVMTIHASKGLEFQIVFALAVGERLSTKGFKAQEWTGQTLMNAENKGLITQEEEAEKMRLFYVAATRAKHRLYLPFIPLLDGLEPKMGEASPLEIFFAYFGHPPSSSISSLYHHIDADLAAPFLSFLNEHGPQFHLSYEPIDSLPPPISPPTPKKDTAATFIPAFPIRKEVNKTSSFSSLLKQLHKQDSEHLPEEIPSASDTSFKESLPPSKKFGVFFHELVKVLPPTLIKNLKNALQPPPCLIEFVTSFSQASPFKEQTQELATLVLNTFTTPLLNQPHPFTLADIDFSTTFRELDFLFPSTSQNYLKGVIDLVFYHQDTYYLVDYKTNWLGPTPAHYLKNRLLNEVAACGYDLQASIYTNALTSYFNLYQKSSFPLKFGGALYLFVRGMHPLNPPSTGICHFFPKKIGAVNEEGKGE